MLLGKVYYENDICDIIFHELGKYTQFRANGQFIRYVLMHLF